MASPPYSLRPHLAEGPALRRWPGTFAERALLGLLLAVPFAVLGSIAAARGVRSAANEELVRAAGSLRLGSDHLGFVAHAFPPVPIAFARLLPGAPGTLAVIGGVCAGAVLELCWERLAAARVAAPLVGALLLGVALSPVFWFSAVQDFAGVLGLTAAVVAIAGLVDFLFKGRTSGGYVAGLSLAFGVLCDPTVLVYALSVLVASPFLAWERFRSEPQAVRSTLAVLAFPTVAVVSSWAFLEWRFTGSVWHRPVVSPGVLAFPGGAGHALVWALSHVGLDLLAAPVFAIAVVLVARRTPVACLGLLVVPADLVLALWSVHGGALQAVVVLDVVGLLSLPRSAGRTASLLLWLSAPAGVVVSAVVAWGSGVGALVHGLGL